MDSGLPAPCDVIFYCAEEDGQIPFQGQGLEDVFEFCHHLLYNRKS